MQKYVFIIILLFFIHSCKEEYIPNNLIYKKTRYNKSNQSQVMWAHTYEYDEQLRTHKVIYSSINYTQYYYVTNTPNIYTISYYFNDQISTWLKRDSTYYLYDGVNILKEEKFYFNDWGNINNNHSDYFVYKYKNDKLHKINNYINAQFSIGRIFLYDSIGNCIKEEVYIDSLFSTISYYSIHKYDEKNLIQSNIYVSLRRGDELNFITTYEYDVYDRLIWEICDEKYDEGIQIFGPYIIGYEYFN